MHLTLSRIMHLSGFNTFQRHLNEEMFPGIFPILVEMIQMG